MNKKILVISTGGTISQIHTEKGIAISNEKSFKGDTFSGILNNFKEKLSIYFYWFTGILWNDRNRCNNEFRECAKNYSR